MKKTILLMILFCIPLVFAEDYILNSSYATDSIFLEKSTTPEDYYSYIQWDLNDITNGKNIIPESLTAYLNLTVIGGLCNPLINIYLLPNQLINLTSNTVANIYTETKSTMSTHTFSAISVPTTNSINITNQLQQFTLNPSNRYLTLLLESNSHNSIVPNTKNTGTELKICDDSNYLMFAAHDFPSDLISPKLILSFEATDDIYLDPYETITLPQINSTIPLDLTGLTRTYLYCTWRIDNTGQEAIMMSSLTCPETEINFTFTDSDTYFISIDYATINYSLSNYTWYIVEIGNAGQFNQSYIMSYPEPPASLFNQIWNTIMDTIHDILCWLGFSSFC